MVDILHHTLCTILKHNDFTVHCVVYSDNCCNTVADSYYSADLFNVGNELKLFYIFMKCGQNLLLISEAFARSFQNLLLNGVKLLFQAEIIFLAVGMNNEAADKRFVLYYNYLCIFCACLSAHKILYALKLMLIGRSCTMNNCSYCIVVERFKQFFNAIILIYHRFHCFRSKICYRFRCQAPRPPYPRLPFEQPPLQALQSLPLNYA